MLVKKVIKRFGDTCDIISLATDCWRTGCAGGYHNQTPSVEILATSSLLIRIFFPILTILIFPCVIQFRTVFAQTPRCSASSSIVCNFILLSPETQKAN
ncbi:MAG TPA: hypothetical protein PLF09_09865, partial [Thiotrichales bacterium]|nr:hypothetical protein [Thiotrichales bacterium]